MAICGHGLGVVDCALIEVRLADGWTMRMIARALDRSPGTVSDEVARHGGRAGYAACAAQAQAASARGRCGRKPRLAADGALFGEVADLLRRGWSPEQIAGRRKRTEDGVEQTGIAVSHEAIYVALYAPLRRTLTYDQGKEMARHKHLSQATGMRVFFADPHSPWQRGSNKNTNGLLRQYFPKGMPLASLTQADLDTVADSLNTRPRKTLGFDTPHERFTHLLANPPHSNTPDPEVRSKT